MTDTAKSKFVDAMCQEYIRGYKDGWLKSHKETSRSWMLLIDIAVGQKVISNEQADSLLTIEKLMRDEGDM